MDQERSIKVWPQEEIDAWFKSMHDLSTLRTVVTVCMTVIFWEHVLHLPAETRLVSLLLHGKIQPARLAVCASRYVCLTMCVLVSMFYWAPNLASHCAVIWRTIYFLFVALWACQSSIFLMRINIVYANNYKVLAVYGVLWLGAIAMWLYNASRQNAYALPLSIRTPYGRECGIVPFPRNSGAAAWGGYVIFDTAVLLGTWFRLRRLNNLRGASRGARSRRWLWASNLTYFGISTAFNVGCLIATLLVTNPTYTHAPSPIAWVVQTVVASRLVLDTKGWAGADDEEVGDHTNTFNMKKRRHLSQADSVISYTVDETVVTSVGYPGDGSDEESTRAPRRTRGSRRGKIPRVPVAPASSDAQHDMQLEESEEGTTVNSSAMSEDLREGRKSGLKDLDGSLEQPSASSTTHASQHTTDIECAGLPASHDDADADVTSYNVTTTRASSDDEFAPPTPRIVHPFATNALGVGDTASASGVSRSSSVCKSVTSTD